MLSGLAKIQASRLTRLQKGSKCSEVNSELGVIKPWDRTEPAGARTKTKKRRVTRMHDLLPISNPDLLVCHGTKNWRGSGRASALFYT